jgi:hypothetical protein
MEEHIHRLRNADSIHTLDESEDNERSATATVNPFVNQMLFRYDQEQRPTCLSDMRHNRHGASQRRSTCLQFPVRERPCSMS